LKARITKLSLNTSLTKVVQEPILFSQFICKFEAKSKAAKKS